MPSSSIIIVLPTEVSLFCPIPIMIVDANPNGGLLPIETVGELIVISLLLICIAGVTSIGLYKLIVKFDDSFSFIIITFNKII